MAVPDNSTNAVPYEWEYYYDYLDPVIVDESKLKYNKCKSFFFIICCIFILCCMKLKLILCSPSDSIVIVFWIVLAAFVGFLFVTLNLMSRSGNLPR